MKGTQMGWIIRAKRNFKIHLSKPQSGFKLHFRLGNRFSVPECSSWIFFTQALLSLEGPRARREPYSLFGLTARFCLFLTAFISTLVKSHQWLRLALQHWSLHCPLALQFPYLLIRTQAFLSSYSSPYTPHSPALPHQSLWSLDSASGPSDVIVYS